MKVLRGETIASALRTSLAQGGSPIVLPHPFGDGTVQVSYTELLKIAAVARAFTREG